jgi:hypothetical protein
MRGHNIRLKTGHALTVAGATMLSELLQGGERNEAVLAISLFAQVVGLSAHALHTEWIPRECPDFATLGLFRKLPARSKNTRTNLSIKFV